MPMFDLIQVMAITFVDLGLILLSAVMSSGAMPVWMLLGGFVITGMTSRCRSPR